MRYMTGGKVLLGLAAPALLWVLAHLALTEAMTRSLFPR